MLQLPKAQNDFFKLSGVYQKIQNWKTLYYHVNQQILKTEKLEKWNVWHFCLKSLSTLDIFDPNHMAQLLFTLVHDWAFLLLQKTIDWERMGAATSLLKITEASKVHWLK